ncbi:MAG: hypothetical protein IV100_18880 [Myxococcales bacterium]|nr:hypothetical protein [Myxococcales bacterium]
MANLPFPIDRLLTASSRTGTLYGFMGQDPSANDVLHFLIPTTYTKPDDNDEIFWNAGTAPFTFANWRVFAEGFKAGGGVYELYRCTQGGFLQPPNAGLLFDGHFNMPHSGHKTLRPSIDLLQFNDGWVLLKDRAGNQVGGCLVDDPGGGDFREVWQVNAPHTMPSSFFAIGQNGSVTAGIGSLDGDIQVDGVDNLKSTARLALYVTREFMGLP